MFLKENTGRGYKQIKASCPLSFLSWKVHVSSQVEVKSWRRHTPQEQSWTSQTFAMLSGPAPGQRPRLLHVAWTGASPPSAEDNRERGQRAGCSLREAGSGDSCATQQRAAGHVKGQFHRGSPGQPAAPGDLSGAWVTGKWASRGLVGQPAALDLGHVPCFAS